MKKTAAALSFDHSATGTDANIANGAAPGAAFPDPAEAGIQPLLDRLAAHGFSAEEAAPEPHVGRWPGWVRISVGLGLAAGTWATLLFAGSLLF